MAQSIRRLTVAALFGGLWFVAMAFSSAKAAEPNPPSRNIEGHPRTVLTVNFTPDGKGLVSSSRDKTIKLWNPQTGQLIRTLEGNSADVFAVAFKPDGLMLASGGFDKSLRLWNPQSGKLIRTLEGHSGPVVALAFSPDGRFILSGSEDASAKIRSGGVKDNPADLALPHWAGVVPMRIAYDAPMPDAGVASGALLPDSLKTLMRVQGEAQ